MISIYGGGQILKLFVSDIGVSRRVQNVLTRPMVIDPIETTPTYLTNTLVGLLHCSGGTHKGGGLEC